MKKILPSLLVALTCTVVHAENPQLPFGNDSDCNHGPMAQFGRYIGDWKISDESLSRETGEWEPGDGARWIFACLGNGTAIQDFWIPPNGTVGTNLRTYNSATESWDIAWAVTGTPGYSRIAAKQNDDGKILMTIIAPIPDPPRKITFFPPDENGWNWKLEFSFDGGQNWTEVYRIRATPFH